MIGTINLITEFKCSKFYELLLKLSIIMLRTTPFWVKLNIDYL